MLSIIIYGVGDEAYKDLVSNVIHATHSNNIDASIEYRNQIDEFVQKKITQIPALSINDKVVSEGTIPSIEMISQYIGQLNFLNQKNTFMKKILVPTDFSPTAYKALEYAHAIADKVGASIKVVHFYHYDPYGSSIGDMDTFFMKELMGIKEKELRKFARHKDEGNVLISVETELKVGFAAEGIVKLSKEENFDLIVMGTTGEHNMLEKVFGSISTDVSKNAYCPVLLIPPKATLKNLFDNIIYACDENAVSPKLIESLSNFGINFQSNIHFIHVKNDTNDNLDMNTAIFDTLFQGDEPTFGFNISTIKNNSVIEGIEAYAQKQDIDLIVMATPHRSFWRNLLHKSMTKQMIFNTQHPIMVIHY